MNKKGILIYMIAVSVAMTTACNKVHEDKTVAVTDVSLGLTSATLFVGETLPLTATIEPDKASNQDVAWESSDNEVATVTVNGLVTAVTSGTAIITVRTDDGDKKATCEITVQETKEEEPDCLELLEYPIYTWTGNAKYYYSFGTKVNLHDVSQTKYALDNGFELDITDEIIVNFKESATQQDIDAMLKKYCVEVIEATGRWYRLSAPECLAPLEVANAYQINECVSFAYPRFMQQLIITEGRCFPDVVDRYFYSIDFWSDEWNAPITGTTALPDDVLNSISTLGLIRCLIDRPTQYWWNFIISSSHPWQTWYRMYTNATVNIIQELKRRNDTAISLIDFYSQSDLDCIESLGWVGNTIQVRDLILRYDALEQLFVQPVVLEQIAQFDHNAKVKSVKSLLTKKTQWRDTSNFIIVLVWILYDDMLPYFDNSTLQKIKNFDLTNVPINQIIAFAENFILINN